jgi:hypothetical protein
MDRRYGQASWQTGSLDLRGVRGAVRLVRIRWAKWIALRFSAMAWMAFSALV